MTKTTTVAAASAAAASPHAGEGDTIEAARALGTLRAAGWYGEHDCGGVFRWRRDRADGHVLLATDETCGADLTCGAIFVARYPSADAIAVGGYVEEQDFADVGAFARAVASGHVLSEAPKSPDSSAPCACDLCRRRRGCFVVAESDAPMPAGWCEIQRDDSPDFPDALVHRFADDVEAGLWVSPAVRAVSVETGATTVLVEDASGEPVIPAGWRPEDRVRIIVPILDAIDRGILTEDDVEDLA